MRWTTTAGMRAGRLIAMLAAAWCVVGGSAFAESKTFDDGNGEGTSVDKINITKFSHDNASSSITYGLEFQAPWAHDMLTEIIWTLDFTPDDGTANDDACIKITPGPAGDANLNAEVFDGCTDSIADDVEVTHVTNTDKLTVTFPTVVLKEANDDKVVKEYAYRVVATDDDAEPDRSSDFAPDVTADRAEHKLVAAQAGPSPTPAPQASDDPDEEVPEGFGDDEASDEDSDSEDPEGGSSDDAEVLGASVGRAQLPDTGPGPDPQSPVSSLVSAGAAVLGAGLLLRFFARRSSP